MPKIEDILEKDDLFNGGAFLSYMKDGSSGDRYSLAEIICRDNPLGNEELVGYFIKSGFASVLFKCIFLIFNVINNFSNSSKIKPKDCLVNVLLKIVAVFGKELSIHFLATGSTWMHKVRAPLLTRLHALSEIEVRHLTSSIPEAAFGEGGCEIYQAEMGRFRSALGDVTDWSNVNLFFRSLMK